MTEDTESEQSIVEAHYRCTDALESLAGLAHSQPDQFLPLTKDLNIEDVLNKYRLWSGNVGAMHSGQNWKKSLDYRLRQAPFHRDQVLRLLRALHRNIMKALSTRPSFGGESSSMESDEETSITSDDDSSWEVSSDSEPRVAMPSRMPQPPIGQENVISSDEYSSLAKLIEHIVDCLWSLPIRRAASLDRVPEAAASTPYQLFDIMYVRDKFPSVGEAVAVRLGRMISRRQQMLRYRRRHVSALEEKQGSIERKQNKDAHVTTHEHVYDERRSLVTSTQHTRDTKATTLMPDEDHEFLPFIDNSFASSVASSSSSMPAQDSDGESPVRIPKRPKATLGRNKNQFICPYCHTTQTISSDRKWRKHVLSDLQPYMCTYAECPFRDLVFDNVGEWYQHEMHTHRLKWGCNIKGHPSFHDTEAFLSHMKAIHNQTMSDDQLQNLRHTFQQPTGSNQGLCTLCGQTSDRLKSHLSRHLQQIALFAVPQTDFMNESDTEDAESHAAVLSHVALSEHEQRDLDEPNDSETETYNSQNLPERDQRGNHEQQVASIPAAPEAETWDYIAPKFCEARAALHEEMDERRDQKGTNAEPKLDDKLHLPDMPVVNPYHQQRPLCGASIGAYIGEHLPPVSLGGIIMVDGEPFGLTVHHLLDAPSDDESDAEETSGIGDKHANDGGGVVQTVRHRDSISTNLVRPEENPWLMGGESQQSSQSLEGTGIDTPVPVWDLEISEDEASSEERSEISSPDEEGDDHVAGDVADEDAVGDIPGIAPGTREDLKVTQPAIDDVDDDFFPNDEDRDEEHLLSHELGHIYASSGIRRWKRDGIVHEIDWALIRIREDRLQPYNIIQGGGKFLRATDPRPDSRPPLLEPVQRRHYTPEEDEYPRGVATSDSIAGMNVHCFGRTTGLQGGIIGAKMTNVRIYRRKTFSQSWHVAGGFGVGGDTGAWVVQNGTGLVCGIVLAWCQRNHIAYIQPMDVILEDIKRTLGAKSVYLPGSKEEQEYLESTSSAPYDPLAREHHERTSPPPLDFTHDESALSASLDDKDENAFVLNM